MRPLIPPGTLTENPRRVLVTGASGLVGSALVTELERCGWTVFRLVRHAPRMAREIQWCAGRARFPEGVSVDAVVHLAGENLAAGRWTDARKKAIRESRITFTRALVIDLGQQTQPPRVWVNASAVGFYGDRGEEILDETSGGGAGFLAEVCAAWEKEARVAETWGARVVRLRTGMVLSAEGGALAKLRPVFRLGLGRRLGNGRQWMSWIALSDLVGVVELALRDGRFAGPVNATAPEPVTNAVFTRALARALHRPAMLPVPSWVLNLVFGEMAEATLLASTRAVPARLEAWNYPFRCRRIEDALREVTGV